MVADYRLAPFHNYVFIHRYFLTHVNPVTNLSPEPAFDPKNYNVIAVNVNEPGASGHVRVRDHVEQVGQNM